MSKTFYMQIFGKKIFVDYMFEVTLFRIFQKDGNGSIEWVNYKKTGLDYQS